MKSQTGIFIFVDIFSKEWSANVILTLFWPLMLEYRNWSACGRRRIDIVWKTLFISNYRERNPRRVFSFLSIFCRDNGQKSWFWPCFDHWCNDTQTNEPSDLDIRVSLYRSNLSLFMIKKSGIYTLRFSRYCQNISWKRQKNARQRELELTSKYNIKVCQK
jgi:hypothetical protein